MSEKIKLSICIPTYNRARFIGEAIESVISQATEEVEIVVSDNASTDNTEEIINRYRAVFPRIKYFRWPENMGPDRNFLKVVELAEGEYCWFLGSDDKIENGSIEKIIKEINKESADIYLLNKQGYDYNLKVALPTYNPFKDMGDIVLKYKESNNIDICKAISCLGYIGVLCFRRNLWNTINPKGYIGTAYVHVYILQQLIKKGAVIKYISEKFVKWRFENDSILMESKAVGRLQIETNYFLITQAVFGSSSFESNYVAKELLKVNIFGMIIGFKKMRLPSSFYYNIFLRLFIYFKYYIVFWVKVVPAILIPASILFALRFIYRLTIKKKKLRKLEKNILN
ncbi:MAG: glycosyltransferase family 2 protein [Bacillota bacterium]